MRGSLCLAVLLLSGQVLVGQQPLPSDYLREQEFFAGHWRGTGNIGDDTATTDFHADWAPGRHCLVLHGTTTKKNKDPVKWTIVSGCDTQTGEMVDCYFASDGSSCVTRWKTLSATDQAGTETGVAAGKPYAVECKAIKKGRNLWTFTSTTTDGKPVTIEYERVKEKQE